MIVVIMFAIEAIVKKEKLEKNIQDDNGIWTNDLRVTNLWSSRFLSEHIIEDAGRLGVRKGAKFCSSPKASDYCLR